MIELVLKWMPTMLPVISVYGLYRAGNFDRTGWAISFGNQALWLLWILVAWSHGVPGVWGFLGLNIAMWWVSARNYLKWSQRP